MTTTTRQPYAVTRSGAGLYELATPAGTVTICRCWRYGAAGWGHTEPDGELVTEAGFGTLREAAAHAWATHGELAS